MGFLKKIRLNSISAQIIIAFLSLLIIITSLEILAYYWISQLPVINNLKEDFAKLQKEQLHLKSVANEFILKERSNEKFFATGESIFLDEYNKSLDSLQKIVHEIRAKGSKLNFRDEKELKNLDEAIVRFDDVFKKMVAGIKNRGYGKYGVIGEFDKSLMDLVRYDFGVDNVAILNLQLYVKDYLLTGNKQATTNASNEVYNFSVVLEKYITDAQVNDVTTALSNYETIFKKLVEIDSELGIYSSDGLQSQLFAATNDIDNAAQLKDTNKKIEAAYQNITNRIYLSFFMVIGSAFIAALLITLRLYRRLVVPVNRIKEVVVRIGHGEIPEKMPLFKVDEVNEMAQAVNNLIVSTKDHQEFANNIGKGNLEASFKMLNEKDVMGKALLDMRDNLRKVEEENKQRNWITQGIALFADILRQNSNNLKVLGDYIVAKLVKYLEVNQAGLYLLNDDNEEDIYLELISCYAYERKKHMDQRIETGEGILGQVILEKSSTYLTNIPLNYIRITSGLGKATPRALMIIPLKQNEIVLGALEIASLNEIPAYQREFAEKIAENIAATIATVKINEKNKRLLEESQEKAQVMKAQEEELRQQMEELHATQEQMRRDMDTKQPMQR